MTKRRNSAREKRFLRVISTLNRAVDALDELCLYEAIKSVDDSRILLRRDMEEYVAYLESVTWWRSPSASGDQP